MADHHQTASKLHELCKKGNLQSIESFLEEQQDKNAIINFPLGVAGYSALHEAVCRKNVELIRILLLHGGNVDVQAKGGYTPLHIAATIGNIRCIEVLLENSANIVQEDNFGNTPCRSAVKKDVKRYLKEQELKKLIINDDRTLEANLRHGTELSENFFEVALDIALDNDSLNALKCTLLRLPSNLLARMQSALLQNDMKRSTVLMLICVAITQKDYQMVRSICRNSNDAEQDFSPLIRPYFPDRLNFILSQEKLDDVRNIASSFDEEDRKFPLAFALKNRVFSVAAVILAEGFSDKDSGMADWSGLSLTLLHSSFLIEISHYKELVLRKNLIETIPRELWQMSKLTKLVLSGNKISDVPKELLQMKSLRNLDLSRNCITKIPKVDQWSRSLRILNLSSNKLKNLDNSITGSNIRELDLAKNRFLVVPECLSEMPSLTDLDLSEHRYIHNLPASLAKLPKIKFIGIRNMIELRDPPASEQGPTKRLLRYLYSKLRNSKPFYTMKLVIVGLDNFGKILMHRIDNDFKFIDDQSTQEAENRVIKIKQSTFESWNLAGVDEHFVTHQCFLSQRALYLVLWNVTDLDNGIEGLKPWLDNIQCRAPKSSIIVVGTHIEEIIDQGRALGFEEEMNSKMFNFLETYYHSLKYSRESIIMVTCSSNERHIGKCKQSIERLRSVIYKAAFEATVDGEPGSVKVMGEMIPESYWSLPALLSKKQAELEQAGKFPLLRKFEFENLFAENAKKYPKDYRDPNDVQKATKFLHDTGTILHYEDPNEDLKDLYFIKPSWLYELMANVVTRNNLDSCIHEGILSEKDLESIVNAGQVYRRDIYLKLLRILARFNIAFRIDAERILIPSKLPVANPAGHSSMQEPCHIFIRQFSFTRLPTGFWSRLISRFLFYFDEMLNVHASRGNDPRQMSPDLVRPEPEGQENEQRSDVDIIAKNGNFETTYTWQSDSIHEEEEDETMEEDNEDVPPRIINGLFLEWSSSKLHASEEQKCSTTVNHKDNSISVNLTRKSENGLATSVEHCQSVTTIERTISHDNYSEASIDSFNEPVSIASFIDNKQLICWQNGILVNHKKLFLLIRKITQNCHSELIEAKVSHSQLGYRAFGFISDHIRTLIKELGDNNVANTHHQQVPCPRCLDLGVHPPYMFDVIECAKESTYVTCGNFHNPQVVPLSELCPELLLMDLAPSMRIAPRDLELIETSDYLLGKSKFEVFSGKFKGKSAAIKVYRPRVGDDLDTENPMSFLYEMRKEATMLSRIPPHPFIIQFHGAMARPKCLLVVEKATGSVRNLLDDSQKDISRILVYRIIQQTAGAMSYLHSIGVIHRDLKSDNLLLISENETSDVNVKLADFGTANFASSDGLKRCIGTAGFIAPESLNAEETDEYNEKIDVFSFSMVLYELITRKFPFHFLHEENEVNAAIVKGHRPPINGMRRTTSCFLTLTDLMLKSWQQEAWKRPSSSEIAQQLKSVAFCLLHGKIPLSTVTTAGKMYYINSSSEIWIPCFTADGTVILVFDPVTSHEKETVIPENKLIKQSAERATEVLSIHEIDEHCIAVALRNKSDYVSIYSQRKRCFVYFYIFTDRYITAMTTCANFVIVGFKDGSFMIISKNDFVFGLFSYQEFVTVNRKNPISTIHATFTESFPSGIIRLLIGCGQKVYKYMMDLQNPSTVYKVSKVKDENRGVASHIESLSSGGTVIVSFIGSAKLRLLCADKMEYLRDINVGNEIKRLMQGSNLFDQRVTCLCVNSDSLWVGTGSGYVLIFKINADGEHCLVTALKPYKLEVRSLISCPNPTGNPSRFVISTGKKNNISGLFLGKEGLCLLTGAFPIDSSNLVPDNALSEDYNYGQTTESTGGMGTVIGNNHRTRPSERFSPEGQEDDNGQSGPKPGSKKSATNNSGRKNSGKLRNGSSSTKGTFNEFEGKLVLIWDGAAASVLEKLADFANEDK